MNAQYPKLKSPCGEQSIQMCLHWFPKNEMIEFLSQEKEERKDFEKQASLGSPKEPRNIMRGGGVRRAFVFKRPWLCGFDVLRRTEKSKLPFSHCQKRKSSFHLNFKGCLQKKISARNRVKMVVPAVRSWKTKQKKPQRKRNCSATKSKSKSRVSMAWCVYVSPADFTWLSEWMLVSSGSQPFAGRCVHR